jgi:hypothetical protein
MYKLLMSDSELATKRERSLRGAKVKNKNHVFNFLLSANL